MKWTTYSQLPIERSHETFWFEVIDNLINNAICLETDFMLLRDILALAKHSRCDNSFEWIWAE